MDYNGASPTKDDQGGAKLEWQDSSIKQVRLTGDRQMPPLFSHIEKVIWVNGRMPAGVWEPKSVSFISPIAQPIQARRRALPILSCLASCYQYHFGKRGRWISETRLLYKPSVLRSRKEIPPDGEASLCIGNCGTKAQAILLSAYHCCYDRQTIEKSHE